MPSDVNADHDKNNQEIKKPTIEHQPKTEAVPSFSDIEQTVQMSPAIEKIYRQLDTEGKNHQQLLEEMYGLAAKAVAESSGEELKQLKEFKIKIKKMLEEAEENEMTVFRAQHIFENAMVNAINDELGEDRRLTSSDGDIGLKWLVDEETPGGQFALVQKLENKPYSDEDEPGEFVFEIDAKTGEKYPVRKLSGPARPRGEMARFYYLDAGQVKAVFDKLEPEVKKSFLDGLKEQIKENAAYAKKLKNQWKKEADPAKKAELKDQITEEDEARAKIEKELAALA